MTVLSRFLGNLKTKPKTLEEQLADLDQLPMASRLAIAVEGESDVLRVAAIARLDYGPPLIALAFEVGTTGVQQAARQRLAALADQGVITLDQLAGDGVDPVAQFAVVGFCQHDDLLKQLLNASSDEAFFYQIALEGVSVQARQLAVERVEDEARLNQLLKLTKGKDKQVYNIVKAKCDGFRERAQRAAETQVEIARLCQRLEAHSQRSFDQFYTARSQQLQAQWALLQAEADASVVARVHHATLACQQTFDAVLKQQADLAAQEVATAKAAQQQAVVIDQLRSGLAHLFDCPATEAEIASAQEGLQALRQQWRDASQIKRAGQADETTFAQLEDGITFQLQQLQQLGSFRDHLAGISGLSTTALAEKTVDERPAETVASGSAGYDNLRDRIKTASLLPEDLQPQTVLTALTLMSERQKQVAAQKDAEKNRLRQLSTLIRRAQSATDSGQSREAMGIRRSIEQKQSEIARLPEQVSKQLVQLDAGLGKLLDWKDYVVEPKKQQLIEQMRGFIGSQENPEALATKISRLQEEWKGLSKGAQDQALWDTFHQLSQTAYQPCKVFFEQQAKIRRDNLEKRILLVTQLETYLSVQQWGMEDAGTEVAETQTIDPSAVDALLNTAIKQWRSYAPFERAGNQPVQREFDQKIALIKAKLAAHYQKNAEIKRQLIDQVQKLVDEEDNRHAVDAAKRLQAQWKITGTALRKDEQVLWRTFRKGCDAIFEKRQQHADAFKAGLAANKNTALALLQEVEGLLKLSGNALLDARARVTECQKTFQALGDLPRADAQGLGQGFRQSVEQFDRQVSTQLQRAKEQVWLDCLLASDKIRLYQLSEHSDAAVALEQAARAYIAEIEQWPKNGLKALEEKMARGAGETTQDENEIALKNICIRAEILCDRPTPDADKALRMQFQMSRLQQGLGQKLPDKKADLDAMVFEWVAVGPVSTAIYEPLAARFLQCR